MLKPFLIRDLHEDPSSQDIIEDTASDLYNATDVGVSPQRPHGLVQITTADYDEIAYSHPQARLSYLDDDDGDIITVGSSLELAQRLEEPASHNADTGFPSTIHLFDIRRTKSSVPGSPNTKAVIADLNDNRTTADPEELDTSHEQKSHVDERTTATENESSEMMNESQRSENNASGSTTSSRAAQTESTPNPPSETADAFAFALRSLMEVAELIKSGVRSKLPELERHLDDARRALPNDITDSMRSAFLAFEEQVKVMVATLNNLPETVRRDNAPGSASLFSEFPTTHSAMNGLRELSVQFGGLGQTLIDAFESSIRGAFPGQADSFFSSFPSFSESANQRSSAPNNEPGNPSSHSENPAFGQTSNNPAAFPSHQSTTAPNAPNPVPPPAPYHPFWGSPQSPYIPPFHWPACSAGFGPIPFTTSPSSGTAADSRQTRPNLSEPLSLEPHPSQSLFIGNVGFNVTQAMIRDVFSSKGLVVGVNLPVDSRSGKHAGFGYLTFATNEGATRAMKELQGTVIDGHRINLEYVDHAPITTVVSPEPERSETGTTAPQTSGVIRHDTIEDTLIPVPKDNTDPESHNNTVHDMLLAQTEARFPPVSQLEAHMLAGQSSGTGQEDTSAHTRNAQETQTAIRTAAGDYVSSYGPFPGASPQRPSGPIPNSADTQPFSTPRHLPAHRTLPFRPSPHYYHPRRAATMREPELHRRSFDPFEPQPGLRRRATERHSLRGPHRGRMGPRHRASFHHLSQLALEQTPNLSAPEEETEVQEYTNSSREEQNQRTIDECVSALLDMGFGDEEGGGRQRLEIYAAATKGDLVEAIEMIEEERKAYEQRE
ncbi:uncharacterized protein BDW70DRAFT_147130 [Aspergillus foveolatus]|uniref:uncharacterized protein n=1 Tax=Aspergillus foveolatus TaxID=210207 RepID=UPI003CCDAE18